MLKLTKKSRVIIVLNFDKISGPMPLIGHPISKDSNRDINRQQSIPGASNQNSRSLQRDSLAVKTEFQKKTLPGTQKHRSVLEDETSIPICREKTKHMRFTYLATYILSLRYVGSRHPLVEHKSKSF